MKKTIIVLADGFEEIEAVTAIDLLRRAEIEVVVAGLNGMRVRGARDVYVEADAEFSKVLKDDFDAVILPGGMPGTTNLANDNELLSFVKKAHDAGKVCAAICAAPSVLAKAGILDEGKRVTCYPGCEKLFDANVLKKINIVNDAVVCDGKIVTGRSAGTAAEFALALIDLLAGKDVAQKIKEQIKMM